MISKTQNKTVILIYIYNQNELIKNVFFHIFILNFEFRNFASI